MSSKFCLYTQAYILGDNSPDNLVESDAKKD